MAAYWGTSMAGPHEVGDGHHRPVVDWPATCRGGGTPHQATNATITALDVPIASRDGSMLNAP